MFPSFKKVLSITSQIVIIVGVYLLGILIEKYLITVLPGSIIGMLLLLLLLLSGLLKVEQIKEVSDFLLKNMMFFFLPSTVSIMVSYKFLSSSIIEVVILLMLSSIITLLATAFVVQYFAKQKDRSNGE